MKYDWNPGLKGQIQRTQFRFRIDKKPKKEKRPVPGNTENGHKSLENPEILGF